jgi:uncharacterized coiled-coil protein SlyX
MVGAEAETMAEMKARLSRLEARALSDGETLIKLATAVARTQKQLDLNAEEARKTAAGLLAMIDDVTH